VPRRTNNVTRVVKPRLCPALLSPMRLCLQLNKSIVSKTTLKIVSFSNVLLCKAIAAHELEMRKLRYKKKMKKDVFCFNRIYYYICMYSRNVILSKSIPFLWVKNLSNKNICKYINIYNYIY